MLNNSFLAKAASTLVVAMMAAPALAGSYTTQQEPVVYAPAPPPARAVDYFSGFYVGISGGFGRANVSPRFQNNGYESSIEGTLLNAPVSMWYDFDACDGPVMGGWGGTIDYCGALDRPWRGMLGAQVGYNQRVGENLILGFEGDVYSGGVRATGYSDWDYDYGWGDDGYTETDIDYRIGVFGTLRGRLGFTSGRMMPYVTGGLAMGQVEVSAESDNFNNLSPDTFFAPVTETHNRVGYAIGAGLEYAVTDNMTIRGEYVHIDLGTVELNTVYSDGGPYNLRSRVSMGTARIGVNFRF